jgi:phenylacetate-CoA ligase
MTDFYDERDAMDAGAREAALMASLPAQLSFAKANAPYFTRLLADIDPAAIISREALATLPVTYKSDLVAAQAAHPPSAE